ncbi:reverse transcriptase family protein [Mesorhizobium sp.]|uniref:reverse transcriptase family protein n=1 Tax=Mesorhizobium sp. TaxID=1871066 RepID=UPI000FE8AF4E|nr:MAG: RNA-directed DNA polymerase [Mesorhizobium sp.]
MTVASPHLYRRHAPENTDRQLVERALAQSSAPLSKGLPSILTLRHLGHLTGADYKYLRSVVQREYDGYRTFSIRKRSGGTRLIASPEPVLGEVQRWIASKVLNKVSVHKNSFAYKPGSNPKKCASVHLGASWLIKIDIHDFFESITERRVYYSFLDCGYQPLVAFELSRLCTRVFTGKPNVGPQWSTRRRHGSRVYATSELGHLPQGAPTSPMLSNMVSFELDHKLSTLANDYGFVYTRYSDDLAFSSGEKFTHKAAGEFVQNIDRILKSFGHVIHQRKTTIAPPGARKVVLGLLVDGSSPRLSKELRARVSDHVRGIEKFGLAMHASERHFASIWGMVNHVNGLISHVRGVDPELGSNLRSRLTTALAIQGWSAETIAGHP